MVVNDDGVVVWITKSKKKNNQNIETCTKYTQLSAITTTEKTTDNNR